MQACGGKSGLQAGKLTGEETRLEETFWEGRGVLVTGATGHIGGWMVKRLLALGAEVVCLVRDWAPECQLIREGYLQRVKVVLGDLGDLDLLQRTLTEHEITTVMHLAAQSIVSTALKDPVGTYESNARGTWCLMEACRNSPRVKQVVVASTDKVYGESRELPYVEEMPLRAIYPHDVSKACAEMIAQSYAKTYGLRVAMARLPNIYGGGDLNWSRIVPGTIRSILQGEKPVINSNGRFIRDYLYVEDAVMAQLGIAEKLAAMPEINGEAFNISSECYLSVVKLVGRIINQMGQTMKPKVLDQVKNEIPNQYLSAQKAREMLGWQAAFSLDEGLRRTIEWYKNYLKG
jgi:CDP-glucose 4,6-dehydratase